MSSPTLLLSMSWGLTWAWAQREPMLYMTTSRSRRSSRSSNSLLANTAGQQVGVLLLKSFPNHTAIQKSDTEKTTWAAFKTYIFSLTLCSNRRCYREEERPRVAMRQTGLGIVGVSSSRHPAHHSVGCWESKYTPTVGGKLIFSQL